MPLDEVIRESRARLDDLQPVLNRIADEVVMPALARNYVKSGVKTHTGLLKTALMSRNARGNICEIRGNQITFGVDYGALPYARYVIEGRGPVRARRAKALRFFDAYGQPIFRKSVGPAPPHDLVYLTPEDQAHAARIVTEMLGDRWTFRRAG